MTPTPEDIALYNKLEAGIRFSAVGDYCLANDAAHVIAAHTAPLRELAEIGRLAVEEEKLRCTLKAKYLASGGKTDDCMGLYDAFFNAAVAHREAACAYLAKHPSEKP